MREVSLVAPEPFSRLIRSPEGPVHYLDAGDGDPVILLHAFGPQPGTTAWLLLKDVMESLSTRRRCIAVDLPNFGMTGPVTFHEPVHGVCVRAVVRVLDHLGIDRAPIVGSSMGATTGIDLTLEHPERVDRLVIGSCHASTGGDPYLMAPFPSEVGRLWDESMADPDDLDKLARLLRALVHDQALVTDSLLAALAAFRAGRGDHLAAALDSVSAAKASAARLSEISCPVLVVHGRLDRMVPFEQALMIASRLPQADVVLMNRCGHWPTYERPAEYARLVDDFLRT